MVGLCVQFYSKKIDAVRSIADVSFCRLFPVIFGNFVCSVHRFFLFIPFVFFFALSFDVVDDFKCENRQPTNRNDENKKKNNNMKNAVRSM